MIIENKQRHDRDLVLFNGCWLDEEDLNASLQAIVRTGKGLHRQKSEPECNFTGRLSYDILIKTLQGQKKGKIKHAWTYCSQ